MSKFDAYHKWLGINPSEQPPHLYRLLGVELFESDPDVLEAAADRHMVFLRSVAGGPHMRESQELLNAVSEARVILLNPKRKQAYDAKLQAHLQAAAGKSTISAAPTPESDVETHPSIVVHDDESPLHKRGGPRPIALAAVALVVLAACVGAYLVRGGNEPSGFDQVAAGDSQAPASGRQVAERGGLSIVVPEKQDHTAPPADSTQTPEADSESAPREEDQPVADVTTPKVPSVPRPALGILDFETGVVALDGRGGIDNLPDGAVSYTGSEGGGFQLNLPLAPDGRATEWSFRHRTGEAGGVSLIHPFRQGHVLVGITREGVHLWAGGVVPADVETGSSQHPAQKSAAYETLFPLDPAAPRQLTSRLARDGAYTLLIDDRVVLTASFESAAPVELPPTLSGGEPPLVWEAGQAGIAAALGAKVSVADEIRLRQFIPDAFSIPGLVAYYPLDERGGLEVRDASGGNWHGKVKGSPEWTSGKVGGGLRLVGATYVDLGQAAQFDSSDKFSIGAWVLPPQHGMMCLLIRTTGNPDYRGYDLMLNSGRPLVHLMHQYNPSQIRLLGGNSINDDRWHHLMMTYDGTSKAAGVKIYVDGQLQPVHVSHDTLNGTIRSDAPLTIGQDDPADREIFEGVIDDLRIYERELTLDEVSLLSRTDDPALIAAEPEVTSEVPDDAALQTATAVVKNLFKDEYRTVAESKTPDAQVKLASKLLDQARQTKDDLASHYVLLREAANLAAEAADATTAVSAVTEMGRQFRIDLLDEKHAVLVRVSRAARTPQANQLLAGSTLAVLDDVTAAERFDLAMRLCTLASGAATKARNPVLGKDISDLRKTVIQLRKDHDAAVRAAEVLEEHLDDADANLTRGRYLCLRKGDWEAGLPLLVKGSDSRLKALAEKEMAAPTEPDAQHGLADEWWKQAEQTAGSYKDDSRERAVYWYQLALPNLSTLQQAAVAKRLREHQAAVKPQWIFAGVASYIQELNALNHPQCPDELSVEHKDSAVRIWGTCRHNTRRIENQTCGWFGKVVLWSVRRPDMIEARLRLVYQGTNWNDRLTVFNESGRVLGQLDLPSTAVQNQFIVTFEFDRVASIVRLAVRDQEGVVAAKEILVDPRQALHVGLGCVVRRPGDEYDLNVTVVGKE